MTSDARKAYAREYYKKHKEKILEQQRVYRDTDEGRRVRIKAGRRRMRRLEGTGVLTNQEWALIQVAWNHSCAYCGAQGPLTQDHRVPVSRGGAHCANNVVPACPLCNAEKGQMTELEFRLSKVEEVCDDEE